MGIVSNKKNLPRKFQEYVLPSNGFAYDGKIPEGKVKIHSFNFETEQIMLSESDPLQERMNRLTAAVWQIPEGFELNNLYQYDQLFIIMAAWDMSTGKNYDLKTVCPKCGHKEINHFRLPDGLKVNRLESSEPVVVTLPESNDKVVIEYPTVAMGDLVANISKMYKNKLKLGDFEYLFNIASNIKSVNGGVPDNLEEAMEYVKSLDGPDVPKLREVIKNRPGVDRNVPIVCEDEECGHEFTASLQLDAEFFLPSTASS